jgi:hypothetical protein
MVYNSRELRMLELRSCSGFSVRSFGRVRNERMEDEIPWTEFV